MKHIEIIGLCGAGKSHFLSKIEKKLDAKIILSKPLSSDGLIYYKQVFLLFFKAFFMLRWKAAFYLTKPSSFWLRQKILFRQSTLKKHLDKSILVDSGVLQPLISYEVEEKVNKKPFPLQDILELLPLPFLVIYLNVQPQLAYERYKMRHFQGQGRAPRNSDALSYFESGAEVSNSIMSYCKNKGTYIIELNANDVDSQETLNEVIKKLNEYILGDRLN
ncbi:MAG: hypothetical protein NE330_03865 [Lentisphaeraceae bacterium]|nr:hypothetical protein [Lentisphaeraceae bacterium]